MNGTSGKHSTLLWRASYITLLLLENNNFENIQFDYKIIYFTSILNIEMFSSSAL
jgi:hypothetical protein